MLIAAHAVTDGAKFQGCCHMSQTMIKLGLITTTEYNTRGYDCFLKVVIVLLLQCNPVFIWLCVYIIDSILSYLDLIKDDEFIFFDSFVIPPLADNMKQNKRSLSSPPYIWTIIPTNSKFSIQI